MTLEATGDGVSASDEAAVAEAADLEQQNQDGAGDAGDDQPAGGALNERDRRMAEIKQRRIEVENQERREAKEQGLTAVITGETGDEGGQEGQAGQANAPALPPNVVVQDGKWFTKMKVSGQEHLVPFDQAFREAQKHHAADMRLQEANRQLREAQELRQRALAEAQAAANRAKQPSPVGDADGGEGTNVDAIAKELETGDIKKAVEMLVKTGRVDATPEAALDRAQIESMVREQLRREQDSERLHVAVDKFRREHKDLASDPVLSRLVDEQSAVVMTDPEFEGRAYEDILSEAVTRTRAILTKHAGGNANNAITSREQRKATVMNPGAGKATVKPQPAPPQPKDGRAVIAEMRERRTRGR